MYVIQKQCFIHLIIYNIEYVQISFILAITQNLCDFYKNLWKPNFTKKLYDPKLDKFVMISYDMNGNTYIKILVGIFVYSHLHG
jgi:hypothetical protein